MSQIPKLFADIVSSINKKTKVQSTHYFHPRFKKIVLQGDGLKGLSCKPGAQLEPRVSDTHFRHYNPSAFDKKTGTLEMMIYLHQSGPGSEWAESVKAGDAVYFMGPANKISLDTSKESVVFLGDETAIGTFLFMQNGLAKTQKFAGAVETEASLKSITDTVELALPTVTKTNTNGEALLHWLEDNFEQNRSAQFYLLGNASANNLLRNYLKEKHITNSQITSVKYWAAGKVGL
jgi:NADPH-dependent ferric siderophore reductase